MGNIKGGSERPESIEQKLNRLKREYEEAQQSLSRAEGSLEADMKRLQEEHNFNTLEKAEKAHEKLVAEKEELEKQFSSAVEELDRALNGEEE